MGRLNVHFFKDYPEPVLVKFPRFIPASVPRCPEFANTP